MKQLLSFFLVGFVLTISSCSKDDDNGNGIPATVANSLKSGTWRISSYIDNGTDETTDYNGFNFTFINGTVTATNSILTVTGSWSTGTDDSRSKLDLDFNSSSLSIFQEISEDWEIVAQSATQVSLRHVSGGSGETDLLVFQKN